MAIASLKKEHDDQFGALYRTQRAHDVLNHFRTFSQQPDRQEEMWEFRLIEVVRDVYLDHKHINQFESNMSDSTPAQTYCRRALAALNASESTDYFSLAQKHVTRPEIWPEIYASSGLEFETFKQFIDQVIATHGIAE